MTRVWDVNNTPFRVCHSVEAPGTAADDGKGGGLKTLIIDDRHGGTDRAADRGLTRTPEQVDPGDPIQFPTNFPIFQAKTRA